MGCCISMSLEHLKWWIFAISSRILFYFDLLKNTTRRSLELPTIKSLLSLDAMKTFVWLIVVFGFNWDKKLHQHHGSWCMKSIAVRVATSFSAKNRSLKLRDVIQKKWLRLRIYSKRWCGSQLIGSTRRVSENETNLSYFPRPNPDLLFGWMARPSPGTCPPLKHSLNLRKGKKYTMP